jgi:hypothetical protein
VYPPNIVVVGQGQKRAYLGDEVYVYDPFNYLVLPVPLPAECEADASPEAPVLLVAINVEPTMLGELILELDEPLPPVGPTPRGISTTPMSEALSVAVIRLLECLKCPLDSRMLGRQRWSAKSSIACCAASKEGRSVPWPAGTRTSAESLGS